MEDDVLIRLPTCGGIRERRDRRRSRWGDHREDYSRFPLVPRFLNRIVWLQENNEAVAFCHGFTWSPPAHAWGRNPTTRQRPLGKPGASGWGDDPRHNNLG